MKYFIMGWDDDSERYDNFYFIGDSNGKLLLFDSALAADEFGFKVCRLFKVMSWHSYRSAHGDIKSLGVTKLILKKQ